MLKVFLLVLCVYGGFCEDYDTTESEITTDETTVSTSSLPPVRSGILKIPKSARYLGTPPRRPRARWVSDVLHDGLRGFAPTGSSECDRHSRLYQENLRNLTLWAVQMYDATSQSSQGLLAGNSYQLGHFDQCISLSVPSLKLAGRYCLVDIRFAPDYANFRTPHPESKFYQPYNRLSIWERIKNSSDLSHRPRDVVQWSLCVPASCTVAEVRSSLVSALRGLDLSLDVSLGEHGCYATTDEEPPSLGFYVVWLVILLAVVISFTATGMDFFVYQAGRPHSLGIRRWLRTFSMYKNMGKLVTPNSNSEFAEFHVYKLIAIMFVIAGHRQMYNIGQTPLYNVDWVERLNSYFVDIVILNGGVVVDTFFVLSGFLTCHYILQELDKQKRFNFAVVFFNRWIRIAPVYMLVVAFYAFVFPHLGDGPLWRERLLRESTRCLDNWWANLLFINNYVHDDNQCMVQSWYLACDMHFFMIGSVLVYILWRWPKLGKALLGLSLATSIVIPAAITYYNSYYGAVLHYFSLMQDPMSEQHYRDLYIPSHTRAGPYLVGIIAAYIYLQLNRRNFKFSQRAMVGGSLMAGVLLLGSIAAGWISYDRARPYIRWEQSLYSGIHRAAWAVGLAWYIVAEATTGFVLGGDWGRSCCLHFGSVAQPAFRGTS
ncbi:nose resistant to fluoxetine protein 6-like isoform X2 [Macrosteles quadrilineatus]|uniref:nose resistant to fluoxetine protein 6-like isoform X2 n=1 Tax=Macrosteles quadrilineatus TaxID=74068 RepID=UPI0023E31F4A|nr:nose resistant to fluoxetine protein 6-like isoform X2 [Macrosteles quadrilineatus]